MLYYNFNKMPITASLESKIQKILNNVNPTSTNVRFKYNDDDFIISGSPGQYIIGSGSCFFDGYVFGISHNTSETSSATNKSYICFKIDSAYTSCEISDISAEVSNTERIIFLTTGYVSANGYYYIKIDSITTSVTSNLISLSKRSDGFGYLNIGKNESDTSISVSKFNQNCTINVSDNSTEGFKNVSFEVPRNSVAMGVVKFQITEFVTPYNPQMLKVTVEGNVFDAQGETPASATTANDGGDNGFHHSHTVLFCVPNTQDNSVTRNITGIGFNDMTLELYILAQEQTTSFQNWSI